ncbi:MAG TPA: radical SAM protein [Steroidobacteraceae bacterium]|jgi:radical SAM superfamily enzyme YgiQ (UPF0313 family)
MQTLKERAVRILLVGPYDPFGGEYTFLAPPLGVWRLAGVLSAAGVHADVFDPNCCSEAPQAALEALLRCEPWDVIGISTTGMTLRFDLQLAHAARRACPQALLLAGGMEATFRPAQMFELAPFDGVVLGEGERPLLQLAERLRAGQGLGGIAGIAERRADGTLLRMPQPALTAAQLRDAIFHIPYERMPYRRYWERLERAYNVGGLPSKAAREASLAEIRSVRLITLNYCPMACSFCSSTNFLHEAQGGVAAVARLSAQDCLAMVERIVAAHPDVRTIFFQDDIFVFTNDRRVLPLCEAIVAAKAEGRLPRGLQFISTNRIDAMNVERLTAMRRAGFRVLGFGIENFSAAVLQEFNKGHIHRFIAPMLRAALDVGITPFLDLILTSPHCRLSDVAETLREAYRWLRAGCEIGMYPYVVPFSGAALARDPAMQEHTTFARQRIAGTSIEWQQPTKILPLDPEVSEVILRIEHDFEALLEGLAPRAPHLPSRVRSVLWLLASVPVMAEHGYAIADAQELSAHLAAVLPQAPGMAAARRATQAAEPSLVSA